MARAGTGAGDRAPVSSHETHPKQLTPAVTEEERISFLSTAHVLAPSLALTAAPVLYSTLLGQSLRNKLLWDPTICICHH